MSAPCTPKITKLFENQRRASDPVTSVWVAANAGSGKTFVLATRVLRLLLAGTPPDRLLCLTFTKAAAAEMANRVFADLRTWAVADEDELRTRIAAIEGITPDAAKLEKARRLFALALETPGGLKIQTINAFGESLLSRFPFEANIASDFKVIDERERRELLSDARDTVFRDAAKAPDSALGDALRYVTQFADENSIRERVEDVLNPRSGFQDWIIATDGFDDAINQLRSMFGLASGETAESIVVDIFNSPTMPQSEWDAIANALSLGSANDQMAADKLRMAQSGNTATERVQAYKSIFITDTTGAVRNRFFTKATDAAHPHLLPLFEAECERVAPLIDRWKAAICVEASAALFRLCDAIIGHYIADKERRGLIDYTDQIEKARNLLTRSDGAAWVLYKLDHGIDHILVDEAQDTNSRQWDIVSALSDEFFAGAAARMPQRTVFAVGDEKQSIFRFQGAEPAMFDRMRRTYARQAREAKRGFDDVPLLTSFRTLPAILNAVDRVFNVPEISEGVISDEVWPSHDPQRKGPGSVEIWPPVIAQKDEDTDDWRRPIDAPSREDEVMRSAARIADVVRHWLNTGATHGEDRSPVTPADVLILVRKRAKLAEAIIRALKQRGVPVAGADRIKLLEHIAILDCLALARFVLQPNDDLTLAALLKSPLCGLDDDDLIALAPTRTGTLLRAIRRNPAYQATAEKLMSWLGRADSISPFAFFSEVLGPSGGRKAFHGRLGSEVDDVLDEFLALILRYQTLHTPSLQGLVRHVEEAAAEIKRDMDQANSGVRIITVHGAKGLEAPFVILADAIAGSDRKRKPAILALDTPNGRPGPLVWPPKSDFRTPEFEAVSDRIQAEDDAEGRRLLYVAMTRARDRLIITGHAKSQEIVEKPGSHWYGIIKSGLEAESQSIADPYGFGFDMLRYGEVGADIGMATAGSSIPVLPEMPDWALAVAQPESVPPRIVAPSSAWLAGGAADGAKALAFPPGETPDPLADQSKNLAIERGKIVHRLLQSLPEVTPEQRPLLARKFVDRNAPDWPEAARTDVVASVLGIMVNDQFKDLFAPHSRAEVPIAGSVETAAGAIQVAGIIDRIAIHADRVIVADYKTNARAPATLDDVRDAYWTQMAVYGALVSDLYPGKQVEAVLIWTAEPRAMVLPTERLTERLTKA